MLRVFSVPKSKFTVFYLEPNNSKDKRFISYVFFMDEKSANERAEKLRNNGMKNVAVFKTKDREEIKKWKDEAKKLGYYVSPSEVPNLRNPYK